MSGWIQIIVLLLFGTPLSAGELSLASGNDRKLLMELYTSEGCSSCPPMERYLNGFRTHEGLWHAYVPVAFHVDYWDYIGWEDRFASPAFALRQRAHAREGNVRSVYTPALIVNGRGWRPGLFSRRPEPDAESAGNLALTLRGDRLEAGYTPAAGDSPAALELHVALLGMDLASGVTAGENEGRTLQHEFVVLGFKSLPGQGGRWQTRLPETHYRGAEPRAIAAWVTPRGSLRPLQAVGGYLED